MTGQFDRNEQEILAAIVKFIADDSGAISKQELEKINQAAKARGLTGFRKTFNETPPLLPSNEDLDRLLEGVKDEYRRKELMEMAIDLAQARVDLAPEDIQLLKTVALVMQD